MISLANKIRRLLQAGKTPKEIAAKLGTTAPYVRVVQQRTGADGLPRLTTADIAYRQLSPAPDRREYHRQYRRRRKAAKANGDGGRG